jgi:hypothetical protein
MMTIQQARVAVGNQIGLPSSFDGSMASVNALPTDQKQQLTASLLAYILAHPERFTSGQVATANAERGYINTLTLTSGYVETDIITELEAGALRVLGTPLAAIGNGVSSALTLTGSLVPFAAVAIIGVLLFSFYKKQTS